VKTQKRNYGTTTRVLRAEVNVDEYREFRRRPKPVGGEIRETRAWTEFHRIHERSRAMSWLACLSTEAETKREAIRSRDAQLQLAVL